MDRRDAPPDLDLLGLGDPSAERLQAVFRDLCSATAPYDGLVFAPSTVTVEPIREEQEYGGQRVTLIARLGSARMDLQIDIGFGDAVTPKAQKVTYPVILEMPPRRLRAYPPETVVAEKLEAMVKLGLTNSRMKDFYDVAILARTFEFAGSILTDAIATTFKRRGTAIPDRPPVALTSGFATDGAK